MRTKQPEVKIVFTKSQLSSEEHCLRLYVKLSNCSFHYLGRRLFFEDGAIHPLYIRKLARDLLAAHNLTDAKVVTK